MSATTLQVAEGRCEMNTTPQLGAPPHSGGESTSPMETCLLGIQSRPPVHRVGSQYPNNRKQLVSVRRSMDRSPACSRLSLGSADTSKPGLRHSNWKLETSSAFYWPPKACQYEIGKQGRDGRKGQNSGFSVKCKSAAHFSDTRDWTGMPTCPNPIAVYLLGNIFA